MEPLEGKKELTLCWLWVICNSWVKFGGVEREETTEQQIYICCCDQSSAPKEKSQRPREGRRNHTE